jgi:hypothetical protein
MVAESCLGRITSLRRWESGAKTATLQRLIYPGVEATCRDAFRHLF